MAAIKTSPDKEENFVFVEDIDDENTSPKSKLDVLVDTMAGSDDDGSDDDVEDEKGSCKRKIDDV